MERETRLRAFYRRNKAIAAPTPTKRFFIKCLDMKKFSPSLIQSGFCTKITHLHYLKNAHIYFVLPIANFSLFVPACMVGDIPSVLSIYKRLFYSVKTVLN